MDSGGEPTTLNINDDKLCGAECLSLYIYTTPLPNVVVLSIDLPWRYAYGGLWRGVNMVERSGMGVARVYPASDLAAVARSYVLP
jgi:hypothetical protein